MWLVAALVGCSVQTSKATGLQPGTYIRSHSSARMTIEGTAPSQITFEIESAGANCHTCAVSGTVKDGVGIAEPWAANDEHSCQIGLVKTGSAIDVNPLTETECRPYCGMRASFEGRYRRPPRTCSAKSQQARRDRFLTLYRAGNFRGASQTLHSLLAECEEFIDWITIDRIRNDLAVAQFHNGDRSACMATLHSTLAAKYGGEDALKLELPPCDFDNYIGVAKATWNNQSLCGAKDSGAER